MLRNHGFKPNYFWGIYLLSIFAYADLHDFDRYVDLQIKFEKTVNTVNFTLTCSSLVPPFGLSAEILINNITTANMRSSNGACYISRRICLMDECSCTSQIYVYSFLTTADMESLWFTCQFRFEQKNEKSHLLVYKTKIYNGSDIADVKTTFQQIAISRNDSTQGSNNSTLGSGDFAIVYILICCHVALVIIASSVLCLKCFNKRKMDQNVNDKSLEDDGHVEIRQPDVYTTLNDTGTAENVTSKISLEESPLFEEHLETKQTYSHTTVNEPNFQEESIIDQIMSGALTRSLKESSSVGEYLQTRHTNSDSALDDMRAQNTIIMIMSDEKAIINGEKESNETTKKQSVCKYKIIKTGNLEEQQNLLQKEDDIALYF